MNKTMKRTSQLFLLMVTLLSFALSSCGVLGPSSRAGQDRAGDDLSFETPGSTSRASASAPASVSSSGTGSVISSGSVDGIASWYGPDFHGKETANGEIYDMNELTAAHRSLPFNTRVRVTNQINNRSVDVRINDRGPYIKDRVIDLSRAAAERIDMIGIGTVPVTVEVIGEGDLPVTRENLSSKEIFTVQLGSFSLKSDADAHASKIRGSRVVDVQLDGKTFFRVYYRTYKSRSMAEEALRRLERSGFDGFVRQVDL